MGFHSAQPHCLYVLWPCCHRLRYEGEEGHGLVFKLVQKHQRICVCVIEGGLLSSQNLLFVMSAANV